MRFIKGTLTLAALIGLGLGSTALGQSSETATGASTGTDATDPSSTVVDDQKIGEEEEEEASDIEQDVSDDQSSTVTPSSNQPAPAMQPKTDVNPEKDAMKSPDKQGASVAPTVIDRGHAEIEMQVYEILDKNSVTVTFEKGQHKISPSELQKVSEFVRSSRATGEVEKFVVAAWSDVDYPASGRLEDEHEDLADDRADELEDALEAVADDIDVDEYEMVERPNWFQKVFATKEAEIKGQARADWLTDEATAKIGEKLRAQGGPSKAVIVARYENQLVGE